MKIHLHRNGRTYGPYPKDSARVFLEESRASDQDWAWTPGQDEWIPLGELLTDAPENPSENSWLPKTLEKIEGNEKKYEIIEWACEQCGLKPLEVDAKRMYVTDDSGERHLCSHPLEYVIVEKHLGPNIPDQILRERTGYREDHFCPTCFEMSLVDQEKDSMVCPKCGKEGMKRGIEFANQTCPRCRKGTIVGQPMDTAFIDEIIRSAQAKEQENEGGKSVFELGKEF